MAKTEKQEYEELLEYIFANCPESDMNLWADIALNRKAAEEVCFETVNTASALLREKTEDILEIGGNYGGFTVFFADMCSKLCCAESDPEKRRLIKLRCSGRENVTVAENPDLSHSYDLIWINTAESSDLNDYGYDSIGDVCKTLFPLIKKGGKIVLCAKNKSSELRNQAVQEVKAAVDADVKIYYPYPDLHVTQFLFTDKRLPTKGEMFNKYLCAQGDYADLIADMSFAKVFVLEINPSKNYRKHEDIIYTKMSVMRREDMRIRTDIVIRDGKKMAVKSAANDSSKEYVNKALYSFKQLSQAFTGGFIDINNADKTADGTVAFEFITGKELFDIIAEKLREDSAEGCEYIYRYAQILRSRATERFEITPEFTEMFGEFSSDDGFYSMTCTNIDFNFDNIIIKDGRWIVIDYEFFADFPVPVDFVIFRAVLYLFNRMPDAPDNIRKQRNKILRHLNLAKYNKLFRAMENNFQKFVAADTPYMRNILIACNEYERNPRQALRHVKRKIKK